MKMEVILMKYMKYTEELGEFMEGILYICPTPIGNLEDITIRTIEVLKDVDLIAAEDTRHTLKLLNHYGIKKPLTSYHEHNIREKGNYLINQLKEGKSIALVSDAGMPGISDPGHDLIKLCVKEDIRLIGLPGPSASLLALVVSGLDTDKFVFEGFLPSKKMDRKKALENLSSELRTIILYESPHRIKACVEDIYNIFGNRKVSLSRELTKHYEETIRGDMEHLLKVLDERELKGEMILVIEGASETKEEYDIKEELEYFMNLGLSSKDAIKAVVDKTGLSKNEVYKESLKLK